MVALTVSTAEKVEEELRRATVVEKHSCDNTSGVDSSSPALKLSFILLRTTHLRLLIPEHTLWKQVGDCLSSCLQWEEEEEVKEAAKELVTMEIL